MKTTTEYEVIAYREGRWWLVEVPELDAMGQARNAAEVEDVAREVIGLVLDVESDSFDVAVRFLAEAGE